jgi:hypothetical protein
LLVLTRTRVRRNPRNSKVKSKLEYSLKSKEAMQAARQVEGLVVCVSKTEKTKLIQVRNNQIT